MDTAGSNLNWICLMPIHSDKKNKLRVVFASLPDDAVQRLGEAFTSAKNSDDRTLPYSVLLELLPGFLSNSDLDLLFFPVTELVATNSYRSDQVSYSLLREMWRFYVSRNPQDEHDIWKKDVTSLRDVQKKMSVEFRRMWDENQLISHFKPKVGEAEARKLPLVFTLLSFASELGELISNWPKEIKDLDDQILLPLRDMNELLVENDPDITPFILFLLKTRLRYPQQILRAIERLSRQSSDLVIVNTDMNVIIEVLLDEAEHLLVSANSPVESIDSIQEIGRGMERFGNIIAGSIQEFDISRDSSWGTRLYGISNRAVQFWTRRTKEAWMTIDKAMPRVRIKSFLGGGLTGPDIKVEIPQLVIDTAVLNASLLKIVFGYAPKLGFSSGRDKVVEVLEERLREQENDLINMLADPGEIDPEVLQTHFSVLVSIMRAYHGDEVANVLSRRGAAASAAAA